MDTDAANLPEEGKRMPTPGKGERSCAVTREVHDRALLIRFVCGPDGRIVPDLKEVLPGRGIWVLARRPTVEEAVRRNVFAKALKAEARADPDLPDLVDRLLDERALQSAAMARKAGRLVTGFAKADALVRSGKAMLVIHASDASEDGIRKIASAIAFVGHMGGAPVEVARIWPSARLSAVLGQENVMHAAVEDSGAGRNLAQEIARLTGYRMAGEEGGRKSAKKRR